MHVRSSASAIAASAAAALAFHSRGPVEVAADGEARAIAS